MGIGYVVSDLHYFARRSEASRRLAELRQAARDARLVVLNGDIFDFRWCYPRTLAQAVEEAVTVLSDLSEACPSCRIRYVFGNHDYIRPFLDCFSELTTERPNLGRHLHGLLMKDTVFLHGDAARYSSPSRLARFRRRFLNESPKGPLGIELFEIAMSLGMHKTVYFRENRSLLARGIAAYLSAVVPERVADIRHVYLGHTHVPFESYTANGLTLHNTGCALRGLRFHMHAFPVDGEPLVDLWDGRDLT